MTASSGQTETSDTRLCFKNIPPNFNEDKLKAFILKSGSSLSITDIKVLKTPDGRSRKLAFVGFAEPEMAKSVRSTLHQTYCGTSRLAVEAAIRKGSAKEHRPWSRHSEGSSRYEAKHGKPDAKNSEKESKPTKSTKEEEEVLDRKKRDFLEAMGASGKKSKAWSNDDDELRRANEAMERSEAKKQAQKISVVVEEEDTDDSDDESVAASVSSQDSADALAKAPAKQSHGSVLTDLDFLKSKTVSKDNLDDDDDQGSDSGSSSDSSSNSSDSDAINDSDEEEDVVEVPMKDATDDDTQNEKTTALPVEAASEASESDDGESLKATSRLFVRNLPYQSTEQDLRDIFGTFGPLTECHVPMDDLGRSKGFGFVSFSTVANAQTARQEMDGTDFQGRLIHVLPGKNAPVAADIDESKLSFKQKQELKRKREASDSSQGQSASFLRGDAVIDVLAERLGLRQKSDLLNVKDGLKSGDAAVRLALGETHLIQENRNFFEQHGVDMEALVGAKDEGNSKERSTTRLLVKNLPFDTKEEELQKLFGGIGAAPAKILLPPSRTIALVEYAIANDAKRAFRRLSYKRFKHVPIYLEYAPVKAISEMPVTEKTKASTSPESGTPAATEKGDEQVKPIKGRDDEDNDSGVSYSVYVKNMSFNTTEESLQNFFAEHVKVRAVRIPTKAAATRKGQAPKLLSMGYGFVECDSEESVRKVLSKLQGAKLDGHSLELAKSTKAVSKKKSVVANKAATKLMVRNVPFQATRKELLQLFGSFGQLKKVRLPKKFDGSHRGFAFIEFLTHQETVNAMTALSRTHLYGRHLVIEWASTESDTVDKMRSRAEKDAFHHSGNDGQPRNKKIRFT